MDFKYPYTDFHELNLDWFLEEFKKYYEKVIQQDQKITTMEETVEQFTTFVTNYFDNLDVQQEINNKLDAMAASGELQAMLQPYFDSFIAAVDDQITTQNRRIDNLQAQINEIVAPDPDPTLAEVAAARVNADGVTYPTLKARCDADFDDLKGIIDDITEHTYNLIIAKKTGYSIGSNGKINANITTDVYSAPVTQGETYYITTDESSLIYAYFSSDPFAPNAVSYDGSRTIQNPKYITAPITGYVAFRTLTGYTRAQMAVGNTEKPYINPLSATDVVVRADLNTKLSFDYDSLPIYEDKYANVRHLVLSDYAGYRTIEFPVFGGLKFNYLYTVPSVGAIGLYFVDDFGNNFGPVEAQTASQSVTAPESAVKCLATVSDPKDIVFPDLANALIARNDTYIPGLKTTTTPLSIINDDTGMLDLFLHVGCIGDSLASGESYWNDGGTVQGADFYQYSWGQFLARKTGNTYYNWSRGGLMAKTWLESEYATECFDGDHKCEAYIIGLGQNDRNHSVTIGTAEDIDLADYHNNADTFYGNYGKIIQKIKEIQPQAKIFVITDPNPYVDRDGYNVPIRDMATIFNDVYVIDMFTYGSKWYKNTIIAAQMRGSHYNAYGYKLFAMMIANYINWIVTNNYTEFDQVELIGTGHSWIS